MADIRLKQIVKRFGEVTAVDNLNLEVGAGELISLLGPSGCGKTTVLRMLAGFERPTSGTLEIGGKVVNDVPPQQREIGIVFQDYAVFPTMSVEDNVAYGLRLRRVTGAELRRRVDETLDLVGLNGYQKRMPNQLSGGQLQRVALARALVIRPRVLLLDEPLSNLDAALRLSIRKEIRKIQQELDMTTVFVTHDQEEALAMSDEIFVINEGEIQQSGTPNDIYDEPINRFVADFIGESNIVDGVMIEDYKVQFAGKVFECVDAGMRPNERVEVVIRPEDLSITSVDQGKLVVKVATQLFRGVHYELSTYDQDGNEWLVHSLKKANVGEKIGLDFEPEAIHVMRFNETEEEFDKRLESYGG